MINQLLWAAYAVGLGDGPLLLLAIGMAVVAVLALCMVPFAIWLVVNYPPRDRY